MRKPYYESILLIERLHRHFLEVLKTELDRLGIQDINNVQSLILYNIGEDEMTVGELTARGYYLGSNVSYNVKKMVENGYLGQERSPHDRRSVRVRLSEKGWTSARRSAGCSSAISKPWKGRLQRRRAGPGQRDPAQA